MVTSESIQLLHCIVQLVVHKTLLVKTVTLAKQTGQVEVMPLMLCPCSFQVRDKLAYHIRRYGHPLVEGLYVAGLELVLLLHVPKSAIPSVSCKQIGNLLVQPYTNGLTWHNLLSSLSCV